MARKQIRTSNYSQEDRTRLGEAVEAARTAAGYRYRTDFCKAHGIRNLRGLELLEQGKTGVGQTILYAVADALPNWDRNTPRLILEGGDPPEITPSDQSAHADDEEAAADTHSELSEEDKTRLDVLKNLIGVEALKDEIRYQLLAYLLEAEGIPMRPESLTRLKTEIDRLKSERRAVSEKANGLTH